MKRFLAHVVAGLVIFGAGVALADRTVTLLSAQARVQRISFVSQDQGVTILANVCGYTKDNLNRDAGYKCYERMLPAGAFKTSVAGLFTGAALTFWKAEDGL